MSVSEIIVRLDLDNESFSRELRTSERLIVRLGDRIRQSDSRIGKMKTSAKEAGRVFEGWVLTLGHLEHAFENVYRIMTGFPLAIAKASMEFEKLEILLRGLSKNTESQELINKEATKDLNYLIRMARETPYAIDSMTESFVKFKVVGVDNLHKSFSTLIDAVAKYGRSGEELKRASVAIQQMFGKEVVSMEELRQQLGEAIPTAMASMARGLQLTMKQLVEVVSTGTLKTSHAVTAMVQEMKMETRGAALELSNTMGGTFERLKTNLKLLAVEVGKGDDGLFSTMTKGLKNFTDVFLTSAEVLYIAQDIGSALNKMANGLVLAAEKAWQFRREIVLLAGSLIGAKLGIIALGVATKAFTGFVLAAKFAVDGISLSMLLFAQAKATVDGMMAASTAAAGSLGAMSGQAAIGNRRLLLLSTRIRGVWTGLKYMAIAMWGIIPPIGKLIIAAGALYAALKLLDKNSSEEDVFEKVAKNINNQVRTSTKDIDALKGIHKKYTDQVQAAQDRLESRDWTNVRAGRGVKLQLEEDIKRGKELADKARQLMKDALLENTKSAQVGGIEDEVREINAAIATFANLVALEKDNIIKETQKMQKDDEEKRRIIKEKQYEWDMKYFNKLIGMYTGKMDEIRDSLNDSDPDTKKEDDEILRLKVKFRQLFLARKAIEDERDSIRSTMTQMTELTFGDSGSSGGLDDDPTMRYWQQLKIKIEGARAKLHEMNVEFAKTQERFNLKTLDKDHEKADEIERLAAVYDALNKEIKARTEALKIQVRVTQRLADVQSFIEAQDFKNSNRNPFLAANQQALALSHQLKTLIMQQQETRDSQYESVRKTFDPEKFQKTIDSLQRMNTSVAKAGIVDMTEAMKDYEESLMTADDATRSSFARQRQHIEEFYEAIWPYMDNGMRQVVDDYKKQLDRMERVTTNAVYGLMDEWGKVAYELDDIFADLFEGMSDALTDFIVTGEMDMQQFLQNILRMIIQSQIESAVAQLFSFFSGGMGGGAGGGGSVGDSAAWQSNFSFADGGVMTSRGALPLKRYARGGIADMPQLALFGEGSGPEAYVPLPDGRSIPVTVSSDSTGTSGGNVNVAVNVINQTGEDVGAEQQGGAKFDGEKYIVDVLMKKLATPGPVRDAVRGTR